MKKLISVCSHNPANLQEMSMFLNYYLPTAEKFAREYEQLLGYENFGENMENIYGEVLKKHRNLGLLEQKDGRIFLTRRGIHVSNGVMADFLL